MNAGTMGDGSGLARTAPPSKICSDCKRIGSRLTVQPSGLQLSGNLRVKTPDTRLILDKNNWSFSRPSSLI